MRITIVCFFFFQAEDGIRDVAVTGVQTCALPISILSPMTREDSRHYSKHGVRNYERLLNTIGQRRKGIGGVYAFGGQLLKAVIYMIHAKTHNRLPLRGKTKLALDIFNEADVVIIGGGGMFGGNKLRSIAGNLFPIILAKQFGKKVIVN